MQIKVLLILWAPVAFVLSKLMHYLLSKRRHAVKSRELGCRPPPNYTPGDPLGMYHLFLLMKENKANRLPEYMRDRIKAVSEQEGRLVTTFANMFAGEATIFTCEPRNIQALLATQFNDFGLGDVRNGSFRPLLGQGIFASDGKQWAHSRAMLRPQFARDQINDLELEETHVQNMLKVLPVGSQGWTDVVDMQPLFFRLTIDSATEFLFGKSVDSQLAEMPGHTAKSDWAAGGGEKAFSPAFDKAQGYTFRAGRLGSNYRLGFTPDFRRQVRVVHEFLDYYVGLALNKDGHEKTLEEGKRPGSSKKQKYVFLEAIAQQTQDPLELREQLINILLAGRDTTASLLSWLFRELALRPDVFTKLRSAVLDDFGTYSTPKEITFSNLKSCSYLQYCLNEALRLYAVVPLNTRTALVDTTLPVGGGPDGASPVFVPKGTEVSYSVHVVHKRKDLWGQDADEFRPERWQGRKTGFEYLPFNGGPRICIGQQFALTEAGYVVVRLLQKFDRLEWMGADVDPVYKMTLTTSPAEGVKLRLRAATS